MTRTLYWATALPLVLALGCASDSGTDLDGGGGGGADAGETASDAGEIADAGDRADGGEEPDSGGGGDVIDPETEPFRTIRDPGFIDERLDIVVVGDGYTLEELGTAYAAHAGLIGSNIFARNIRNRVNEPFRSYRDFFRVHRVHLPSNESGVDADGTDVDTALDGSTRCAEGLGGGVCYVDPDKVHAAIDAALADANFTIDWRVVVLNTDEKVGGALFDPRGNIAVFAGGYGGNADYLARQLALREMARAFANVGYEFGGEPTAFDGAEPTEVNLTLDPSGAKWARWDGYNQDEDGLPAIGVVEGGAGFDLGIYRPTPNSNMGPLVGGETNRFNAVVREALVLSFYEPLEIILSKDPAEDSVTDPVVLFVQSIDRDRTAVRWTVNGTEAEGQTDYAFGFEAYAAENNLPAGEYTVTARVFDDTSWIRLNPRGAAEATTSWTVTRE